MKIPGIAFRMLLLLVLQATAFGQGDLYGPEAPADVAWIRVINALGDEPMTARVADTDLKVAFAEGSAYLAVAPGDHEITVGEHSLTVGAEPESFQTVALLGSGPVVIQETGLRDISRGLLGLMNLTSHDSLTLLTPAGEVVVEDVLPGHASSLAISPASTGLDVSADGAILASVAEQAFELAEAYTVVVLETPDGPVAVVLQAGSN